MSAKEQTHSNDKAGSKQPSPKLASQDLDTLGQLQTDPSLIIQRARLDPSSLTPPQVLQLQRMIGNQAVGRLLGGTRSEQVIQKTALIQRMPLRLPYPYRGRNEIWEVDTEGAGREYLKGWIEQAAQTNLPALRDLIELLKVKGKTAYEQRVLFYAEEKHQQALESIKISGAKFVYSDQVQSVTPPGRTLIMRSINSGDMYQVQASMTIHSDYNLLIWYMTPESRRQAEMVTTLINDSSRVYYTDDLGPPKGYEKTETWTTADIEKFIAGDLLYEKNLEKALSDETFRTAFYQVVEVAEGEQWKPEMEEKEKEKAIKKVKRVLGGSKQLGTAAYGRAAEGYREYQIDQLAKGFTSYTNEEGKAMDEDIKSEGKFNQDEKYVIVNFRATGHSDRPGANAPTLDTGTEGMQQLMRAVQETLGIQVRIVPMGEEPRAMKSGPNLIDYWLWKSVKGSRGKQAALLHYLKEHYKIVGAIGMRSGVMDQIAILGIPIISLDISPHKGIEEGFLPDLGTSKGWDRGLKLERAYRRRYGHVFIKQARAGETDRLVPEWKGAFTPEDLARIKDGIRFYFTTAGGGEYMHASHPLQEAELRNGLKNLEILIASKPITAYDLVNHLHPYLSHIHNHVRGTTAAEAFESLLLAVEAKIAEVESGKAKSVKWMRDHQIGALLTGDRGNSFYKEQRQWIAEQFGLSDQLEEAVEAYRKLDATYQETLDMSQVKVETVKRVKQLLAQVRAIVKGMAKELSQPQ